MNPIEPPNPDRQPATEASNPYLPSREPGISGLGFDDPFQAKTIAEMARWQTFFAVMLSVGLLLTAGMILLPMLGGGAADIVGGLICVGGGGMLLYGIPALMLWKAASSARQCAAVPNAEQVSMMLRSQLHFWRAIGIIAAILIGFYGIAILVAVFGFAGIGMM